MTDFTLSLAVSCLCLIHSRAGKGSVLEALAEEDPASGAEAAVAAAVAEEAAAEAEGKKLTVATNNCVY